MNKFKPVGDYQGFLKDPAECEANQKYMNDLDKAYDWLVAVYEKQGRWLSDADLWVAYPFKWGGLERSDFMTLLNETKLVNP